MPPSGLVVTQILGVTVVNFGSASILDGTAVEKIGQELYALVEQQAVRKLLLDFSPVKFLSSQMLGVLIALQKKAQTIKGKVVIVGLRAELMKVFTITRIDKLFQFAANEEQAMPMFDAFTRS